MRREGNKSHFKDLESKYGKHVKRQTPKKREQRETPCATDKLVQREGEKQKRNKEGESEQG